MAVSCIVRTYMQYKKVAANDTTVTRMIARPAFWSILFPIWPITTAVAQYRKAESKNAVTPPTACVSIYATRPVSS